MLSNKQMHSQMVTATCVPPR